MWVRSLRGNYNKLFVFIFETLVNKALLTYNTFLNGQVTGVNRFEIEYQFIRILGRIENVSKRKYTHSKNERCFNVSYFVSNLLFSSSFFFSNASRPIANLALISWSFPPSACIIVPRYLNRCTCSNRMPRIRMSKLLGLCLLISITFLPY